MATPLPLPVRQHILRLAREQLLTAAAIAHRLHLPPRTVRGFLQQRQHPQDDVGPRYDTTPHRAFDLPEALHAELVALALEHPTWGAPFLRLRFRHRHPDVPLPSARTLQRWLQPRRPQPAPPGRRPQRTARHAQAPHDIWQVDAVDQVPLASGELVNWSHLVDEYTGAFLTGQVFPPGPLQRRADRADPGTVSGGLAVLGANRVPCASTTGRRGGAGVSCRRPWRCGCWGLTWN